jgi:hypothetical protein
MKKIIFLIFIACTTQSCRVVNSFNTKPTKILISTSNELIENNITVVKNIFKSIERRTNEEFEQAQPYMETTLDSILLMLKQHEDDLSENQKTVKNYAQTFNVLNGFNNTINLFISDSLEVNAGKATADVLGSFNAHLQDFNVQNIGGLKLTSSIFNATNKVVSTLTRSKVTKLKKQKLLAFLQESQQDYNNICNYLANQNKQVLLSLIKRQQMLEVGEIDAEFKEARSRPGYNSSTGKQLLNQYVTTNNKWVTDSLITETTAQGYNTLKQYYANLMLSLQSKQTPTELVANVKELYNHIVIIRNAIKQSKNEN